MATLDPSGFQMAVVVIADGRRYNLWANPAGGSPVGDAGGDAATGLPEGLPIVESLDIEMGLGLNSKVTINIAAPYELGMQILRTPLLRIGNVIEVQVGYPRAGRFMPWISAMAAQPSVTVSPTDGLTATINGEGGAFAALRNTRSVEYQNKSYADIITELAGNEDYNFIVQLPDQQAGDDPLYRTRERVSQANQSDWFFMQFITRSANCDAWVEPSADEAGRQNFVCRRRAESFGAAPRYTFVMRGQADFDRVWPIFDFSSNAEGVWLPGGATGVRVGGINPTDLTATTLLVTGETTDVPATADSVPSDGGARVEDTAVRLTTTRDDSTVGEHVYVSERDPRGAAEVAESTRTEAAGRGGIQATISSFGIPDLLPSEIIAIAELGVFDSLYQIQKVTHRLAPGEWTMSLDLINNAVATDFMALALQGFAPVVNTETAPVSAGDAEGGGTEVVAEEV